MPTNEGWLEKGLWATETFIANGDDLPIRQFIALFQGGGGGSGSHLILKVQSHVAQLFLDVTDNLTFSCRRGKGGGKVSSLPKKDPAPEGRRP